MRSTCYKEGICLRKQCLMNAGSDRRQAQIKEQRSPVWAGQLYDRAQRFEDVARQLEKDCNGIGNCGQVVLTDY